MIQKKFTKKTVAVLAIATAVVALTACGKKIRDAKSSSSDKAGEVVTTVPVTDDPKSVSDIANTENNTNTAEATAVSTNTENKEAAGTDAKAETKTESKTESKKDTKSEKKTTGTSGDAARDTEVKATSATRNAIVATAKSKIGTDYELGGVGPEKFDNCGFIYYCYKENGVKIPRLTADIAKCGTEISLSEAEPGDILVFSNSVGGPAEFLGIYTGNDSFIASFKPGKATQLTKIGGYWEERYISVRRL